MCTKHVPKMSSVILSTISSLEMFNYGGLFIFSARIRTALVSFEMLIEILLDDFTSPGAWITMKSAVSTD